ncbi:inverse autotransporter beta domain-containing protein [Enterobacteriaceae endosymbiont of Macroplea appendiculata]|uniref:inverse autotransporter beta domain-containing protein n=1 Tax=Enterobacteriaceae endosymbiont of Macroplea appendiculata TaxID=2675790 RepID=UPI0014499A52|nr:inverse autotransporter beta domain-containing protein [Enterobacteriaceae endosymbiont of Macroplea appendiculata]QJC31054.1 hypothetical protein GJT86_02255 [Enterobacteriaceae endosymbiont of Macroplea appendiculata]
MKKNTFCKMLILKKIILYFLLLYFYSVKIIFAINIPYNKVLNKTNHKENFQNTYKKNNLYDAGTIKKLIYNHQYFIHKMYLKSLKLSSYNQDNVILSAQIDNILSKKRKNIYNKHVEQYIENTWLDDSTEYYHPIHYIPFTSDLYNRIIEFFGGKISTTIEAKIKKIFASLHANHSVVNISFNHFPFSKWKIKFLLPIKEKNNYLFFTQNTFTINKDSQYVNTGLGIRKISTKHHFLLGINNFLDYDYTTNNYRLSLGLEFWKSFIKLSSNVYFRLNNWKPFKNHIFPINNEKETYDIFSRPANSFDVILEGYLPKIPQMIFNVKLTKFLQGKQTIFNNHNKYYDNDLYILKPSKLSFGLQYRLNSLLYFNFLREQTFVDHNGNNTVFGIGLNFNLNSPIYHRIDHFIRAVKTFNKSVIDNKYDFVNRNNIITFEYKKVKSLNIHMLNNITNLPKTKNYLRINDYKLIKKITFENTADFIKNKGLFILQQDDCVVILPEYVHQVNSKTCYNTYNIKVIIEDIYQRKKSFTLNIRVLPETTSIKHNKIDIKKSSLQIKPNNIYIDYKNKCTVLFTAKRNNNTIVTHLKNVQFIVKDKSNHIINSFHAKEKYPGIYSANIYNNLIGSFTIQVKINNIYYAELSKKVIFFDANQVVYLNVYEQKKLYAKNTIYDHIILKINLLNLNHQPVNKAYNIIVRILSINDRQGKKRTDSGKLQILNNNKVNNNKVNISNNTKYQFTTNNDGTLQLDISDPDGIGVKTKISISIPQTNITSNISLIYAVPTSPDTDKANMYGYMDDKIYHNHTTLHRPPLYSEYAGDRKILYLNEFWSVFTIHKAHTYCKSLHGSLPTKETMIAFNKNYSTNNLFHKYGWPYKNIFSNIWTANQYTKHDMQYYFYISIMNNKYYRGLSSSTYNVFCENTIK